MAQQVQDALITAIALQHLALILALRGDVNDAAQLIGYVNLQYKELGYERESTEKWGYEKLAFRRAYLLTRPRSSGASGHLRGATLIVKPHGRMFVTLISFLGFPPAGYGQRPISLLTSLGARIVLP